MRFSTVLLFLMFTLTLVLVTISNVGAWLYDREGDMWISTTSTTTTTSRPWRRDYNNRRTSGNFEWEEFPKSPYGAPGFGYRKSPSLRTKHFTSISSDEDCDCPQGYVRQRLTYGLSCGCIPAVMQLPSTSRKTCADGFRLVYGRCEPIPAFLLSSTNGQSCGFGYQLINGECQLKESLTPALTCGVGEMFVGGLCQPTVLNRNPLPIPCPAGLKLVSGRCQINHNWDVPPRKFCPGCYCRGVKCPCDLCHLF